MSPYTPARGQGCPRQTDSCKPLRKTGPRPVSYTEHLRAGDKQPHNLSTITTINPVHVLHQQHGTAITDSHRKLKTSSVTGGSVGQMPDQLPQTEVRPLLLLPTTWKPLSVELVVEVSRAHFHGNTEMVCAFLTLALTNVQKSFPGATSHVK